MDYLAGPRTDGGTLHEKTFLNIPDFDEWGADPFAI